MTYGNPRVELGIFLQALDEIYRLFIDKVMNTKYHITPHTGTHPRKHALFFGPLALLKNTFERSMSSWEQQMKYHHGLGNTQMSWYI